MEVYGWRPSSASVQVFLARCSAKLADRVGGPAIAGPGAGVAVAVAKVGPGNAISIM